MITLFMSLLACNPVDTDTDTPPDTETPPDPETPPAKLLESGQWSASIVAIENSTCGESFVVNITMAPTYSLTWSSSTNFVLDDGAVAQRCEVGAGDAVTCEPYVAPIDRGTDFLVVLTVPTTSFDVLSPTAFNRVERGDFSCQGEGCAAAAERLAASGWPCTMDIVESYTR